MELYDRMEGILPRVIEVEPPPKIRMIFDLAACATFQINPLSISILRLLGAPVTGLVKPSSATSN